MKRNIFSSLLIAVAMVAAAFASHEASAQVSCPSGQECAWVNVDNVTAFGVAPSASSQHFYNDQATKDHLCQVSGYQSNPGFSWAVQQSSWSKCNAEYHVGWLGYWDVHHCGGASYLTAVYCARTAAAAPAPEATISVSPQSVQAFNRTTIAWSSSNADSCQASGDWSGAKATSGSEQSGTFILSDKTFTITCNGKGGTASASAKADIFFIQSAPTISWSSAPATAASGVDYSVAASANDTDGDLASIVITKDGASYASAYGSSGQGNIATGYSNDVGPKTVTYRATAVDSKGNSSPEIVHTVTVAAPVTPITGPGTPPTTTGPGITVTPISASVSASPSCVAPGGTISVTGSASGGTTNTGVSTIASNNLEKDSNKDGVYGVIASRGDAGTNSATVSVPSNETSDRYDFREAVNGGTYSSVASVSISPSCGGGSPSGICSAFPILCGGPTVPTAPPAAPPSASISSNASCVAPNSTVFITSNAGGSPINSNVIQKDSPASGSQYGDGVFGTIADYGSSGGPHTLSTSVGSEGYYDFKALVNGSASATTRVRSSASCAPGTTNPPGTGIGGGGFPFFPPAPPLICTGGKVPQNGSCVCPAGTVTIGAVCVTPGFTAGAIPSSVLLQVIPIVGGASRAVSLWVGPIGGYSQPVTFTASLPSSDWKSVEYSWNGGAFSSNPSATVQSFGGSYPNLTLAIRVTGTSVLSSHQVSVSARGQDGKTSAFSFTLQVNKTDPSFKEE
jgi:hypothetical protein